MCHETRYIEGCRFSPETIELCVRWYITYRLSYRDLVAMMAERGIEVSHTTIMRWVLHYVPEYERRWARFARSPGSQPARERTRPDGLVRYPRKISCGGNLYLLVRPQGGRYWHYHYRGKRKTLSLGIYPDVPVSSAQSRHRAARRLLAAGGDPSLKRRELRCIENDGLRLGIRVAEQWPQVG